MLLVDRQTAAAEHINNNRNIVILKPGNIAIARTAIQRDKKKEKEKVAKLCYIVRSTYHFLRNTGHSN